MAIETKYIWMDGELVEREKAVVPFLSPALHYGISVFEGIRCYDTQKGPAVFRLREHMQRLINSGRVFGWKKFPYTVEQLVEATRKTVAANDLKECYIRPLIYQGGPNCSLGIDDGEPLVGIAAWGWANYLGKEALENGIRANISSFTRHHPNVAMTKAKIGGNYVNSVLAKSESTRLGFQEAIMLDPQGYVAECTGENLFMVRDGVIYTPLTTTILEGITRASLATLAGDLGLKIVEQPISRDQLYIADEVFVCGTAAECVALSEIDFRVIGSGKMGPVTRQIQKVFFDTIHGNGVRSKDWLVYVKD